MSRIETKSRSLPLFVLLSLTTAVVAIFLRFGRWGFNPTEEGYILSQSRRILQGLTPHAEIISPRPLGSALLHLVDVILPGPLVATSRFLTLLEVAAYTTLFCVLIFGVPLLRWRGSHVAGWLVAFMVNLHTFPMMAWQTIDGLLFCALGYWFLRSREGEAPTPRPVVVGFACLGAALLMKQSFLAAPLAGAVLMTSHPRPRPWGKALVAAVAPAVLYAVWVFVTGAGGAMVDQLTASVRPSPVRMLNVTTYDLRLIAPTAACLAILLLIHKLPKHLDLTVGRVAAAVMAIVFAAHPFYRLGMIGDTWGIVLFWTVAILVGWLRLVTGRWDPIGFVLLITAWMTSLSVGYPNPELMGGTLFVYIAHRVLTNSIDGPVRSNRLSAGALSIAGVVFVAWTLIADRSLHVYFDKPEGQLTSDLSHLDPDLRWIRTNLLTEAYLQDAADCIRDHPADHVAVVPDNPILYPIWDLDSPFSTDWLYSYETEGAHDILLRDAAAAAEKGDFLVLFQIESAHRLPILTGLPSATPGQVANPADPWAGPDELIPMLQSTLGGESIPCGSFIANYSAP